MELNEIIQQRASKLESLKSKGIDIYSPFKRSGRDDIGKVISNFQEGRKVAIAGRIMAKRSHGKVMFLDLRDATGSIQLYVKADFVGQDKFEWVSDIDIADIAQVNGELFKTHSGEPTVKVEIFP